MLGEGPRRLAVGVGDDDGQAGVAALAQLRHEGHLSEQRHLEPFGQLGAATGPEDLVARAVVTGEPGHVLDDALDLEVHLLGHERGPLGDRWAAGWGVVTT